MKISYIIISFLIFCSASPSLGATLHLSTVQQTVWGQSVYVVGDHPYLGNNNPVHALKLSPHKYPTWEVKVEIAANTAVHYRFLIKSDAPNAQAAPTWISDWQTTEQINNISAYSRHTITGLTSKFLNHPRDIFVFMPGNPSLKRASKIRMLYFHDGQNLFSDTATAPSSIELERWFPSLALKYPNEQLIVIGIGNSPDRMREYVPPYSVGPEGLGIGNLYGRFMVEELIPYIEHDYLKLNAPPERTLAGASLGGLISVYLTATYSDIFTNAISLSGSFQFAEVTQDLTKLSPTKHKIYLDSGTSGPGNDNYFDNYFMRDKFLELGWIYGGNIFHVIGYGQSHNEDAWRQRLPDALRWTLQ